MKLGTIIQKLRRQKQTVGLQSVIKPGKAHLKAKTKPLYGHTGATKTLHEVLDFIRLCAAIIGISPQQILDWDVDYFLFKLHGLEDNLINYQYLADMESFLKQQAISA